MLTLPLITQREKQREAETLSKCLVFCSSAAKGVQRQLNWPDANLYDLFISISVPQRNRANRGVGGEGAGRTSGRERR